MIVVVTDAEASKIIEVIGPHPINEHFRRYTLLISPDHGCRSVRVICANIVDGMATHALEAHPDICLDMLEHMAKVYWAIGIRQSACNEYVAWHVVYLFCPCDEWLFERLASIRIYSESACAVQHPKRNPYTVSPAKYRREDTH